jgi:hypothetical protein
VRPQRRAPLRRDGRGRRGVEVLWREAGRLVRAGLLRRAAPEPPEVHQRRGEQRWLEAAGERQERGNGKYGSGCSEMDVWEANSQATAVTPRV